LKSRTLRQAICDIREMEYSLEQMARSLVESGDYRVSSRLEPQAEYHPLWDAFNRIKERTPLLTPKLRLPYRELQALAVL
jgi:hypothetical protein